MSWTEERIEMLKRLWADGLSASQIAAELGGVSRNGVIGKVHRIGLSGRAKSPSPARPRRKERARLQPSYRPSRLLAAAGGDFGFARGAAAFVAPVEEPAPELLEIPVAQRKTLLQLSEKTCHWPVGDPGSVDFFFCGGDAIEGRSYCAYHCRAAYQPLDRRRSDSHIRFLERTA